MRKLELFSQIKSTCVFDGKTNRPKIRYQLNGFDLAHVELEGHLAKRYSGLAQIQRDLRKALQWARRATEINSQMTEDRHLVNAPENVDTDPYLYFAQEDSAASDERQAFFVAALTFYGKAFTDAPVRGTKMETDWLDTRFRDIHKKFMSMRHFLAAHAGDKESGIPMVILVPEPDTGGVFALLNVRRNQASYVVEENANFETLIEHAQAVVTTKMVETEGRIEEHLVQVVGWPEIFTAAATGKPLELDKFKVKRA